MFQQQTQANRIIQLQNNSNYEINFNNQPNIFPKKLFEKILNLPQNDKNKARTVTVNCLQKNCR
jgi:hypothetical protein